jgi:hypothetical protein
MVYYKSWNNNPAHISEGEVPWGYNRPAQCKDEWNLTAQTRQGLHAIMWHRSPWRCVFLLSTWLSSLSSDNKCRQLWRKDCTRCASTRHSIMSHYRRPWPVRGLLCVTLYEKPLTSPSVKTLLLFSHRELWSLGGPIGVFGEELACSFLWTVIKINASARRSNDSR